MVIGVRIGTLFMVAVVNISGIHCTSASPKLPKFTAKHSIEMTRLAEPFLTVEGPLEATGTYPAPDGTKVVFVTRRGNLTTGRNEFSLHLMQTRDIREFLSSQSDVRPHSTILTVSETSSFRNAIDGVTWVQNGNRIAFIGRHDGDVGQVYVIDMESHKIKKLTNVFHDIRSFSLSADGRRLVYAQFIPANWDSRNSRGYAVVDQPIGHLTSIDPLTAAAGRLTYFVLDLSSGRTTELNMDSGFGTLPVTISDNGRYAVVAATAKVPYPNEWATYEYFSRKLAVPSGSRDVDNDALASLFSTPNLAINRFQLLDLASGITRPLLESPAVLWGYAVRPLWSSNSKRVIVGPTYLPLVGVDQAERDRRRTLLAMVEVEIATGEITRVIDIPYTGDAKGVISSMEWASDACIVVNRVTRTAQEFTREDPSVICKDGAVWAEKGKNGTHASTGVITRRSSLRFEVVQDMNSPPELAATDAATGRRRVISDFNPQFRSLEMTRVEKFTWKDRLGREFIGGLLKPASFRAGTRYPIVLQTYGFDPNEFLIDGPQAGFTTAFAARALAAEDMLVLQMPSLEGGQTGRESGYAESGESPRFVIGLEAAIETLDRQALIDRDRVGLIGFSWTGQLVQHALVFGNAKIAAATIADSVQDTPFCYSIVTGAYYLEFEQPNRIGASFWGEGIKKWIERSTIFHLDRIRAPIRFEHTMTYGPPCTWDAFNILRRHRRPVEMVHFPRDEHNLRTPFGRYTSLQGNVDWYSFWLRGVEDSAPEKAEQYQRWRRLRIEHDAIAEVSLSHAGSISKQ